MLWFYGFWYFLFRLLFLNIFWFEICNCVCVLNVEGDGEFEIYDIEYFKFSKMVLIENFDFDFYDI